MSHAGLIAYLCRAYAGLTAVPHRYMVDPHDRPFAMRVMGVTWEWSAMPVGARELNGVSLVTWRLSVSERRTDRDETKSIKLTNYRRAT